MASIQLTFKYIFVTSWTLGQIAPSALYHVLRMNLSTLHNWPPPCEVVAESLAG